MPKLPNDNPSTPLPVSPENEISRRTMLDYFHMPSGSGRFLRIFSSREKMAEGMKTLAWVIPLTLLIWIYAVREQVVQPVSPNVGNVVVNLKSSDPNLFVQYDGIGQPKVNLQLTGPQQSLELVREQLTMVTAGLDLGLTIYVPSNMGVGPRQPVNVVDSIQSLDIFKNNGVTVQLAQPDTLYVDVDKKGHREPSILVPASVTNLAPESRFQPAKVTVVGPESVLHRIDSGELKVCAKLDGYEQLKQPGTHLIPSVPLELVPPQDTDTLRISPDQVTANVVVTASDVTYEIPDAIPVYIQAQETTLNRYDVVLSDSDRSIANLEVKGPQQAIDAIKNKTFAVKANLDVEITDAGKEASRTLRYELPDGVSVSAKDAAREVRFTLNPR
jgi:hypothetical protein